MRRDALGRPAWLSCATIAARRSSLCYGAMAMAGEPSRPCRLAVKAVPRASRNEVVGWLGDRLKIKVAAPPQDGRANDALEAFLAEVLAVPRRRVRVVAGHGAAAKVLEIDGLEQAELARRLEMLLAR